MGRCFILPFLFLIGCFFVDVLNNALFMDVQTLGLAAGFLTSIASIPQLIKVIKTKNVEDISALMLVILILGLSLWVWYGILQEEIPIILSNAFALLVNISLLVCFFLFKEKKSDV